jgi:hypothetical protein
MMRTVVEHFLDHVASTVSSLVETKRLLTFTLCRSTEHHATCPQENCKYILHIPKRVLIGEITHGRDGGEKLYRDQENLPTLEDFEIAFREYFTKYAQYDAQGNALAHVTFEPTVSHEGDEGELVVAATAIAGIVNIQYGPLYPFPSHSSYKSSIESLLMRYTEVLRRQNQIESELFCLREVLEAERREYMEQSEQQLRQMNQWRHLVHSIQHRGETQHAYLQQRVRTWFADYAIREDCVVCWMPLRAEEVVFPACGHLICTTCHDQCHEQQHNRCPVCRHVYDMEGVPVCPS